MVALANPLSNFMWGANGEQLTPAEIARKREIAQALMQKGNPAFNGASGWAGILGRGLEGAISGYDERQASQAEKQNATTNQDLVASLLSGSGPQQFPAAPSANGTSSPVAYEPNGNDVRDGIVSTANALGIDPVDLGTAISYETGGTFDPTKAGPTTQWGQHKGLIQFGEPQAKQFGVDWSNPVGSQLGPDGAVAKYLANAGVKPGMGMLDIYSAINAGHVGRYNASDANNGGAPGTVRDKVEQQMAGHRAKALALLGDGGQAPAAAAIDQMAGPTQVASLDQSVGLPQQAPVPQAAPPLPDPRTIQDMPVAGAPADQQVAQALAGPDLSRIPVTAGGNAGVYQPGQGNMQAIAAALGSPYASDQTRQVASLLLKQQLAQNDPVRALEMEYKRAQIAKLTDPNARDKFGNSVIWGQDADGKWVAMQPSSGGGLVPAKTPEGISLSPPGIGQVNLGTSYGFRDRNGNIVNDVPIDNAGKAAAAASGKAQGEAAFDLPRVEQNAQQTLDVLERMKTHPGREGSTGFIEGMLPSRTSDQVDFQSLADQTQGQSFLQAFQMLKGAGQITDIEGRKATEAISRLGNQRLSDADYLRAISDLEDVVKTGLARARVQAGQGAPTATAPASPAKVRRYNPSTGELE